MQIINCPKCDKKLETRPACWHWKGEFFSGLYCELCNSLWSRGEGYDAFMKAIKERKVWV